MQNKQKKSPESLDIDKISYTADDFLNTSAPYELVYAYRENQFEEIRQIEIMAKYASTVGIRNFKNMYSKYKKALQLLNNRVYDNPTSFSDQPIELNAGEWECNDYGISKSTDNGQIVACSHPIMPTERLVNIDTGEEKLKLAFSRGRRWREIIVGKDVLSTASSVAKALAPKGVLITSESAKYFVQYLCDIEGQNEDIIPERKCVTRLGYMGEEGFAPYVDGLIFDGDANYRTIYNSITTNGNYEEWHKIALECRKMSLTARIMLASSFASVLVQPLGALPFFVHLWGVDSGTGKTVALMLAASVWGNVEIGKYIQTFNSTQVGQEKTAAFLNNLPLLIDELQLAKDSRGNSKFDVYQLAQGTGRTRGNRSGGVERTPTWANCILTTGETPLVHGCSGAGALNRVIDIECNANEVVITDGMRISSKLKKHYGYAGKIFVLKLYSDNNVNKAIEIYQDYFKQLSEKDTTEKQAMAAAIILTADKLCCEWMFGDMPPLTVAEISEFLQTKSSVSAGQRGYQFICDWVAMNSNKFSRDNKTQDTYGIIDDDWVFINNSKFRAVCEEEGFNSTALLSWLKNNKLIQTQGKNNVVMKRINGVRSSFIVLKLPNYDDENNINISDYDIEIL